MQAVFQTFFDSLRSQPLTCTLVVEAVSSSTLQAKVEARHHSLHGGGERVVLLQDRQRATALVVAVSGGRPFVLCIAPRRQEGWSIHRLALLLFKAVFNVCLILLPSL